MAKYIPGTIRENDMVPVGTHLVRVDDVTEKSAKSGKLMSTVRFKVIDSGPTNGLACWKRFCFGTEADPLAEQHETWVTPRSVLREYFEFLAACQVKQIGDTEEEGKQAKGAVLSIVVRHQVQTKGEYAGKTSVEVEKFMLVSQEDEKITSKAAKKALSVSGESVVVQNSKTVACRDCEWTGVVSDYASHDCNSEIPF